MIRAPDVSRAAPRAGSLGLFLVMAVMAVGALQVAHGLFPGDRVGALAGRLTFYLSALGLLIVGSRWLLRRDGLADDRLGLGARSSPGKAVLVGAALAVIHLATLFAVLFAAVPFKIGAGPLTAREVAPAAMGYLAGNFVEELVFRGYLLIALAHWIGLTRALWLLAPLFGLFHFPGLDAVGLAKMMLTTGAMHFVYAYAFLVTRSLWTAVVMHAVGNTLLHAVMGVDTPGALSVRLVADVPLGINLPFVITLGVSALLALVLSRLPATRRGAAWLLSGMPPNRETRARPHP